MPCSRVLGLHFLIYMHFDDFVHLVAFFYIRITPKFVPQAQTFPLSSSLYIPTAYSTSPHECVTDISNFTCPIPNFNYPLLPPPQNPSSPNQHKKLDSVLDLALSPTFSKIFMVLLLKYI